MITPSNILLLEQAAVAIVDTPGCIALCHGLFATLPEAVGDSGDLPIGRQPVDQQITAVAAANHADADPVIGAASGARQDERESRRPECR